ncbi:hypothetical protein C1708_15700 [Streptomyces sp. DH-12]|nr:hypothetical protein C1708_15700 [Streptomyces sp. DH-12]
MWPAPELPAEVIKRWPQPGDEFSAQVNGVSNRSAGSRRTRRTPATAVSGRSTDRRSRCPSVPQKPTAPTSSGVVDPRLRRSVPADFERSGGGPDLYRADTGSEDRVRRHALIQQGADLMSRLTGHDRGAGGRSGLLPDASGASEYPCSCAAPAATATLTACT